MDCLNRAIFPFSFVVNYIIGTRLLSIALVQAAYFGLGPDERGMTDAIASRGRHCFTLPLSATPSVFAGFLPLANLVVNPFKKSLFPANSNQEVNYERNSVVSNG